MVVLIVAVVAALWDSWTGEIVRDWLAGLQHTLARTFVTGQRSHFVDTSVACAGDVSEDGAW